MLLFVFLILMGILGMYQSAKAATPYEANGRLSVSKGKVVNAKG